MLASAHGARSAKPSDFIPEFNDDEQPEDPAEIERRAKEDAALQAADQRAFLAGLMAATKKPNGK